MKKTVLATYEGIYSLPLVEACLMNKRMKVVKILKSGSVYSNKKNVKGIIFLLRKSSLLFIVPKCFELILFYFYRFFFPKSKRPFKTLSELSKEYNVPVETVADVNDYQHVSHSGCGLFSLYFNQVFSLETLQSYEFAYNVHPAPLPLGRGLFSQFWLLLNQGEVEKYFQSIHKLTEKIDAGEVVAQKSSDANLYNPSMADYMNKVTVLGVEMLMQFEFDGKSDIYRPERGSYYSFPKTNDVLMFWRKGCRFMRVRDFRNYLRLKADE